MWNEPPAWAVVLTSYLQEECRDLVTVMPQSGHKSTTCSFKSLSTLSHWKHKIEISPWKFILSESKRDVSHTSWTEHFEIGEKENKEVLGRCGGGWRVVRGELGTFCAPLWVPTAIPPPAIPVLGHSQRTSNAISDFLNVLIFLWLLPTFSFDSSF